MNKPRKRTPPHARTKPHKDKTKYDRKSVKKDFKEDKIPGLKESH